MTTEHQITNAELAWSSIDHSIAHMTKITDAFIDGVKQYGLIYQLQWAASDAEAVALGTRWLQVRNIAERDDYTLVMALDAMIEETTDELMDDRLRGGSTSRFSNAVEDAKRAAASKFVREAKQMLRFLTKER